MGKYLSLYSIRDETFSAVQADPPLVWKIVSADDPEMYEAARREATPKGILGTATQIPGCRSPHSATALAGKPPVPPRKWARILVCRVE